MLSTPHHVYYDTHQLLEKKREKERKGEREKERNKEGRKEEKKRKRSLSFVYSSRQTLLLTWEESWAPIQL